jgi:hypothetical protein
MHTILRDNRHQFNMGSLGAYAVTAAVFDRVIGRGASDSEIQRRKRLAFSPLASATAAVDTPGWRAAVTT